VSTHATAGDNLLAGAALADERFFQAPVASAVKPRPPNLMSARRLMNTLPLKNPVRRLRRYAVTTATTVRTD
jgi:hypothetical protein